MASSFKPRLRTRQRVLTRRLGIFRKKSFEVKDVEHMSLYADSISFNFLDRVGYKENNLISTKDFSFLPLAHEGISYLICFKVNDKVYRFNSLEVFELWLIRRILTSKVLGYKELYFKLCGYYSLYLSLGLANWGG